MDSPASRAERTGSGPDRDLVRKYSYPRDKKGAAVFVGRQDTIEAVERNCRDAMDATPEDREDREDALGMTFLVQGAPGAGKTTLLGHLKRRWADPDQDGPIVLAVHESDLRNTSVLVRKIASAMSPAWLKTLRQVPDGFGAEVKAPGVGSARFVPGSENDGIGDFDLLAEAIPPVRWKQPLCIMVDEIQNITREHAESIRKLHEGWHRLPIVPIYAGLADSESVLGKHGASRMQSGNVHTLGALAPDECAAYVKRMLDRCRIACTPEELDPVVNGIAERSEGWPQHLHTETAALFRGLDEADCDLAKVDFDAVGKQAAACRKDSYRARQSPAMRRSAALVAAVMAAVPEDGMHEGEVPGVIRRTARTDDVNYPSWCLPKGMDADMFMEHLIHQGALQLDGDGKLSCPIPSLRTWLIDRAPDARQRIAR